MLSSVGFEMSKQKAQLLIGSGGRNSYMYWSDVQRQWERAYSNSKIVDLIGSQSVPVGNVPEIRELLGKMESQEVILTENFINFYAKLASVLTTVKNPYNIEPDLYETLLDRQLMSKHEKGALRILDIGPGAGRHMVATFLDPAMSGSVYVGLESVGLCYSLQNMAAALLRMQNGDITFYDGIDYEFGPDDLPSMTDQCENVIYHLPLWMMDKLPGRYFDLIICSHLLDELPPNDFTLIMQLMHRVLAEDGTIYCRGSQQKSMIRDMYLYGMGTFHGYDITASILAQGMKTKECELIACQMTRVFVREESLSHSVSDGKYVAHREDESLIESMHDDFIKNNIALFKVEDKKIAIWGERGYKVYLKRLSPYVEVSNLVGLTNRLVVELGDKMSHRQAGVIQLEGVDYMEYTAADLVGMKPDVIIVASMLYKSIHRQIRELSNETDYKVLRSFNYPVAFIYR